MSVLSALIGTSTVIRHVQHLVIKVAESDAPVLITGEPGTGKELVARSIHDKSARASGPFVPVKCGAIAEDILEAELFGHEKGAFPGAHQAREGRFSVASGGTLFLEEVSKLSPRLQANLLRVLQEGVIQPLGSNDVVPVNVRIVCSTSLNIDQAVRERLFREDLYYRLAGCAVYIPPLRERREDIPPLVDHFISKYNQAKSKSIFGVSPDAMSALLQHSWGHNINELENLIERIVVLKNAGSIEVCDMPPRLRQLVTNDIDAFYERANSPAGRMQQQQQQQQQAQQQSQAASHAHGHSQSQAMRSHSQSPTQASPYRPQSMSQGNGGMPMSYGQGQRSGAGGYGQGYPNPPAPAYSPTPSPGNFDENSEIDQFIKKEIDLGSGIDFYRVVEEFENRLIAEALRRTNHNKNRAAQLLSMNRTTLVEKLKKRAASSSVKVETGRVKRNPAFTIFDGLGNDNIDFEGLEYLPGKSNENLTDID